MCMFTVPPIFLRPVLWNRNQLSGLIRGDIKPWRMVIDIGKNGVIQKLAWHG
jgi:hypothetical protein